MLGHRDPERLHATRQRRAIQGLDDQMEMRALDAEVHDAKAILVPARHGHRGLAHREERLVRT